MIITYVQLAHNTPILTPSSSLLQQIIDAYVDDTDLWDIHNETDEIAIQQVQHNAQLWSNILELTGGRLKALKCFWYLILWQWVDGIPSLKPRFHTQHTLTLRRDFTWTHTIKRLHPYKSLKTLGLWTNPMGKMNKQFEVTKEKILLLTQNLEIQYIPQNASPLILSTYLPPVLCHIFHSTTLTSEQCHTLKK